MERKPKMNELQVTGKQSFMGKDIPVMLGGFGVDKKCLSDKTVAEIHDMREADVRRRITDNIKRFNKNIDFIDLKSCAPDAQQLMLQLGYSQMQVSKAEHIYILSERGYAKLIKIMESDLAWEIHDKLIDEYFNLRETANNLSELSPQLQLLINMELKQKQQDVLIEDTRQQVAEAKKEVQNIRDTIIINPKAEWREATNKILNNIGNQIGDYQAPRNEAYETLKVKGACRPKILVENLKSRALKNGMSKSKVDKLCILDVLENEPRLKEIYISIVKEMGVKNGQGIHSQQNIFN